MPVAQLITHYHQIRSRLYRVYARLRPHHFPTQHQLANVYLQSNQVSRSIDLCEHLRTQSPTNPWLLQTLAAGYQAQGQWHQALMVSQQAIELEPDSPWLHHGLGKLYGQQEQWELAIECFERSIALDSTVGWFHYNLGEALVKTGQWSAAIPILQHTQKLIPRFAWTAYFLGEALLAEGRTDEAIAVYEKVLRRQPWMKYLRSCLAYARHTKIQDQSIQKFCQANHLKVPLPKGDLGGSSLDAKPIRRRVLMIAPYPTYPPKMGAIARMFYEMKALGKNFDLTVVSFVFKKADFVIESALKSYCQFAVTVTIGDTLPFTMDQPDLIHRYSSQRMTQVLKQLQAVPYDIVITDFIQMAQYSLLFPNAFRVLGEHNIESELLRRSAQLQTRTELQQLASQHASIKSFTSSLEEADRLARYETELWKNYHLRFVVSEQDKQHLDARCNIGKTIVVNNGIDTKKVQVISDNPNKIILFIGTLSYYPNIDGARYFVDEILPLIWEQDPGVTFWMAGAEPPQVLWDLTTDSRVRVIANPENMDDVARQCCMTVVPLRTGSGTRIKILHAMALGMPIVSTSLGCEGLAIEDGRHLFVRDRPVEFAAAVLTVLQDASVREGFRREGRVCVERDYDWERVFAGAIDRMREEVDRWWWMTGG
jgi:tetratricopeptide (TPR) repeat protein